MSPSFKIRNKKVHKEGGGAGSSELLVLYRTSETGEKELKADLGYTSLRYKRQHLRVGYNKQLN